MEPILKSWRDALDYLQSIGNRATSGEQQGPAPARVPAELLEAMEQLIALKEVVDRGGHHITPDEITGIGDHGLLLLVKLREWSHAQGLETETRVIEQISLLIAQWVIRYGGELLTLEPIVNSLALIANRLQSGPAMEKLAELSAQIVYGCGEEVRQDFDSTDPRRPWRVLNINRSITATRTHNPALIRTAFDDLVRFLPLDAPGFFEEAMGEMVRLDYPQPVRELVEEYVQRSRQPRLH